MHNPNITQRHRQIKLFIGYVLMTIAVIAISVVCLMLILGYRFNLDSNRLEQGGLIQFRTIPTGATVELNDRRLNFTTPGRSNVSAGEHAIRYSRQGYLPWQKVINIDAGELRWLNYIRLIPENISTEPVMNIDNYSSSLVSPDQSFIALLEDKSSPTVSILDIRDRRQIEKSAIELSDDIVAEGRSSYRLVEWDTNSRFILLEQTSGGNKQYIRVDRTDPSTPAINISDTVRLNFSSASFYKRANNQFLVQTGDSLRLVNLSNQTISGPLVTDVEDYALVSNDEIVFVAERDKRRVVGVYVDGKEVIVRTIDEQGDLNVGMGTYYDDRYLAMSHGKELEIIISPERNEGSAGRNHLQLELDFVPDEVAFSPTGRFVIATHGSKVYTYDLEIDRASSFTFPNTRSASGSMARWIDSYYLAGTESGRLTIAEFDGHNKHQITSVISGSQVAFDDDGELLYSFAETDEGYVLQRSIMVID